MDQGGQSAGNRSAVIALRYLGAAVLMFVAMLFAGCTAERAYTTAQAWQVNQCARLPEKADYDRCVRNADGSYDSYRREAGAGPADGR